MAAEPIRFVHASDLHLERPLTGLPDAPDDMRQLLLDAPFQAAEQVFQTALSEQVDFVVLSGDVVRPDACGPYALAFLIEQFERLAGQQIAVYWVGGSVDPPERWPTAVALPSSVRRFAASQVESITHRRGDQPVACLVGQSQTTGGVLHSEPFSAAQSDVPVVAVSYGQLPADRLADSGVDYWALGGRHRRESLTNAAHYAGTPQGRSIDEPGPHGCLLVEIDAQRHLRVEPIDTDVVRWHRQEVSLTSSAGGEQLRSTFDTRMQTIVDAAAGRAVLIDWQVLSSGATAAMLRRDGLEVEIVKRLRNKWGQASPPAWSTQLELKVVDDTASSHYDEDTILGDFLRAVRQCQDGHDEPLALETYVPLPMQPTPLGRAVAQVRDTERSDLLRDVARLGVDLLSSQ